MNKDYTKYTFNNNVYCKCRLVLAILQKHVSQNKNITFERLVEDFPDSLQSNSVIQFSKIRVVVKKYDEIAKNDKNRFFVKADEILSISDSQVVVSREWNKENIQNFINRAEQLGHSIAHHICS